MKTPPRKYPCAGALLIRVLLPAAFAALSAGSATADTSPAAEKTHTLFMGVDLSVEQNKEFHPVRAVAGNAFVIDVKGKPVAIPMDQGVISLQVGQSLKLTENSAVVANLKGERTYTLRNDPNRKNAQAIADAEGLNASYQSSLNVATEELAYAQNKYGNYQPSTGPFADVGKNWAVASYLQNTQAAYNTAAATPGSSANPTVHAAEWEDALDAMDVTFEVSAERPLSNPYVVIIARYHAKDAKPGAVGNWIYARALKPVGREAKKVHLVQGGFPPGFELLDFQVHLYNQGEEVATNVAPKRVALTRDEAFQYVLIDYLSSHKKANLPAAPVMGRLPPDWRTRLTADQLSRPYFIKVSKGGLPLGIYADEACSQPVTDPYLDSVVKGIRFTPALDQGKAVDGTAKLRFGDIRI